MKKVVEQEEKHLNHMKKKKKLLMKALNDFIINDDSHLTDYHLLIENMNHIQESRNRKYWIYESERDAKNWLVCMRILKSLQKCYENDCRKIQSLISKVHNGPLTA